jgi:hypothetical protein
MASTPTGRGRQPDHLPGGPSVTIRDMQSGALTRDVAPQGLGDYYSCVARRKDLILTINSNYYYLNAESRSADLEGERRATRSDGRATLISKTESASRRSSTETSSCAAWTTAMTSSIRESKAQRPTSWDGRYIAFHALKPQGSGYNIQIIDLQQRTLRTLPGLGGSALFPSWTKDGRLCFRYDGPDYRGFMMASGVLIFRRSRCLPSPSRCPQSNVERHLPETARSQHRVNLVMIWAP